MDRRHDPGHRAGGVHCAGDLPGPVDHPVAVPWAADRRGPGHQTPLFLLLFSATYLVMAAVSASNFGQKLTHTDALYFTVTVFTTVGFGDITAKSEGARLLATAQMMADLVVLGIGAKIILGAVTRGRQRQPTNAGAGQPGQ
ncbi:MAG TPA: potassium channel family protein [Streptosporangiaceae bacterium]|nr:potassium channel family protein [Streptosporangiaceae bacterium]